MKRGTFVLRRKDALAQRRWYLVDAAGKTLGRLASEIANILRGKGKPAFSPSVDGGDFLVVINAAKVRLTGKKLQQKVYYRHSGYPGGTRSVTAGELLATYPERVIRRAVAGMLPKNRLGRRLATKLKVYAGPDHPHHAQTPQALSR